jgi:hypothetical protein
VHSRLAGELIKRGSGVEGQECADRPAACHVRTENVVAQGHDEGDGSAAVVRRCDLDIASSDFQLRSPSHPRQLLASPSRRKR